ncbi:MAG: response regulator [Alphaproteobacteria bacterium]|nr:response regulator [Alphaproteobacteria bacterium]
MKASQELKFLIVDDQKLIHEFVGQILRELNFSDIHSVYDGEEAKSFLERVYKAKVPVDVVFLDLGIPNMNGLEVLRYFRARPQFDTTAFVMLTAESEKKNVMDILRAGANAYIIKPMSRDGLIKKVQEIQTRLKGGQNKWFDRAAAAAEATRKHRDT